MDTLKRQARVLKREAYALHLAARDPRMPWLARVLVALVAAYAARPPPANTSQSSEAGPTGWTAGSGAAASAGPAPSRRSGTWPSRHVRMLALGIHDLAVWRLTGGPLSRHQHALADVHEYRRQGSRGGTGPTSVNSLARMTGRHRAVPLGVRH